MNEFWFWFSLRVIALDLVAILILAYLLWHGYAGDGLVRKIGIVVMLCGLFAQAVQYLYIVCTGVLLTYTDYPLWLLKDIGILVWSVGLLMRERENAGKT